MPFGRSIGSAVSMYLAKGMRKKYKGLDGKVTLEKVSLQEQLESFGSDLNSDF